MAKLTSGVEKGRGGMQHKEKNISRKPVLSTMYGRSSFSLLYKRRFLPLLSLVRLLLLVLVTAPRYANVMLCYAVQAGVNSAQGHVDKKVRLSNKLNFVITYGDGGGDNLCLTDGLRFWLLVRSPR